VAGEVRTYFSLKNASERLELERNYNYKFAQPIFEKR
jgi:hypothetical protein